MNKEIKKNKKNENLVISNLFILKIKKNQDRTMQDIWALFEAEGKKAEGKTLKKKELLRD